MRFASAFNGAAAPEEGQKTPEPPPEAKEAPEGKAATKRSQNAGPDTDDDAIRALAWSLRPQSIRRKDRTRS